MKTSILPIIAIISIGLTPVRAIEEGSRTPDELAKLYFQKRATFDFEALAPYIHPYALSKFRMICNDLILSFSEKYSDEKILSAFEDITTFDDLKDLSDEEYWIYIMGTINSYSEEYKIPTHFKFLAAIEEDKFLYLLFLVKDDLISTSSDDRLQSLETSTFLKHNGEWKHYGTEVWSFERYLELHAKCQ